MYIGMSQNGGPEIRTLHIRILTPILRQSLKRLKMCSFHGVIEIELRDARKTWLGLLLLGVIKGKVAKLSCDSIITQQFAKFLGWPLLKSKS